MNEPTVLMYTRQGCHLCDDAHQTLLQFGLRPTVIDIDERADLRSKYNDCVPVVVMDGKIRFRGKVNPVLLGRLIAGTQEGV